METQNIIILGTRAEAVPGRALVHVNYVPRPLNPKLPVLLQDRTKKDLEFIFLTEEQGEVVVLDISKETVNKIKHLFTNSYLYGRNHFSVKFI